MDSRILYWFEWNFLWLTARTPQPAPPVTGLRAGGHLSRLGL